jgi:hypothetical protein
MHRLDRRRKELQQQKDDLIKETKAKVAAIDNVRQQLDIFLKVRVFFGGRLRSKMRTLVGCYRSSKEGRRPDPTAAAQHFYGLPVLISIFSSCPIFYQACEFSQYDSIM